MLTGLEGWLYTYGVVSAYRLRDYECRCCEVMVVRFCSSSPNFYVLGVCRNPDLSDNIFDCLLTATA